MQKGSKYEQGQAILLIALAMVALLGMTAVAVDGSLVYADRRHAQSSADAASLAGVTAAGKAINQYNITSSNWSCSNAKVANAIYQARMAAISQAQGNGITIDGIISDQNGVQVSCDETGKFLDVKVMVTQTTQTAFMHLIANNLLTNTVTSVSRVRANAGAAFNYTILTVNTKDCNNRKHGLTFEGVTNNYINTYICGGGIYSNGCLGGDGWVDIYVRDRSSCKNTLTGNQMFFAKHYKKDLDGYVAEAEPAPSALQAAPPSMRFDQLAETPLKVSALTLFAPPAGDTAAPLNCGFFPEPKGSVPTVSENLCKLNETPEEMCARPGANNVTGASLSNKNTTLNSGLYCVTGDVTLGSSNTLKTATNAAVTMVFLSGGIKCTSGCAVQLASPKVSASAYPAEPGLLFYSLANTNPATVWQLDLKSNSYLYGSVFLPYADVTVRNKSTAKMTHKLQVCALNFHTGGSYETYYQWDDGYRYKGPPEIELHQ